MPKWYLSIVWLEGAYSGKVRFQTLLMWCCYLVLTYGHLSLTGFKMGKTAHAIWTAAGLC